MRAVFLSRALIFWLALITATEAFAQPLVVTVEAPAVPLQVRSQIPAQYKRPSSIRKTPRKCAQSAPDTWHNIDLDRNEVRLVTSKTGRSMVIPIALPLWAHIDSLPTSDAPDAPLHPRAFDILVRNGRAGILSAHFSDLLAQAGLREKQSHQPCGIGRSGRRRVNGLTFHSLRRTATSWLHEAGVANSVAQALIGHESDKVHHGYISVGREALKAAVGKLPKL